MKSRMTGEKMKRAIAYLPPEKHEALANLSNELNVSISILINQAIDTLLATHATKTRGADQ
jgi:hypothetical protein